MQECACLHRENEKADFFRPALNSDDRFTRFQARCVFSSDATMASRYVERRRNKHAASEEKRASGRAREKQEKKKRGVTRYSHDVRTELLSDSKSAVASSASHHHSYFLSYGRNGCLRTHPTIVAVVLPFCLNILFLLLSACPPTLCSLPNVISPRIE